MVSKRIPFRNPLKRIFFKATSFALGESVRLARVLEARWSDWPGWYKTQKESGEVAKPELYKTQKEFLE